MNKFEREKYLNSNLPEHDKLLASMGGAGTQPPKLEALNNNPSKAYFNNAGIGGGSRQENRPQSNANQQAYQSKN